MADSKISTHASTGNGSDPVSIYGASWINACQTGSRNTEPRANLFNAVLALHHDPFWRDVFGYDEMLQVPVLRRGSVPLEDIHTIEVHHWMQANGLETMGIEPVREAVMLVAYEHRFHPLRDFLTSLEWDRTPRLEKWLPDYVGTVANDYYHKIGRWFLLSMIARVMRPGCKCDYMPVFEGPQGIAKSKVCAILGGEYFSDTLPDLGGDHVRVSMHVRGKWVLEVSELHAFNRTDLTRLKAFMTTQVERYTPKFAHREVFEPRQCVMIGTTNKDTWSRDETGARRFWPVVCGVIKPDELERVRPQLFAEALAEFTAGQLWWPDQEFEQQTIKPLQDARYEGDAWEDPIRRYLENRSTKASVYEIATARSCLDFLPANFKKADETRIIAVLRQLGWVQHRTKHGRFWVPGTQEPFPTS